MSNPTNPDSGVKLVVTGKDGHGHATVPAAALAPLQFKLKHILVPVDFSEPSRKAIHYARVFAKQFGARLTLLHVVEPLSYPPDFAVVPLLPPDAEDARIRELTKQLQTLAGDIGDNLQTTAVVASGRPWQGITEHAAAHGVDLIIVSTHGYTGLKHVLLGSVAEKIVRHAPCPVLVVRAEETDFA
jgi:universal stress protein A